MFAQSEALGQSNDSRNAASWYRRAHEQYQAITAGLSEDQWNQIWEFEGDPRGMLSPEMRGLFSRFQPVIDQIKRGAAQHQCDFGAPADGTPFAAREHLAPMRNIAKVLRFDLYMRLCDGDQAAAVEHTTAALRIGQHVAGSESLISCLVGNAIFALGDGMAKSSIDYGVLTAEGAAQLAPHFDAIDSNDPFGYRRAVRSLPTEMRWMTEQLASDEGRAELLKHADWFVGDNMVAAMQLAAASPDELRSALQKCEALAKRISAVFEESDLEKIKAAIKPIDDEIKRGDHGPLADGLLGVCARIPTQIEVSMKNLGETRALLKSIADGTIDARTLANAALLYMKAIIAIDAIDRERFEQVRRCADEFTKSPGEEVVQTLVESQPIVDILREASLLRKCEFESYGTIARHHAGMREAARLLLADSARLMHGDDPASAVDRWCIALRMAAHLSAGKSMISSLVAQAIVRSTDAQIAAAQANNRFSTKLLERIVTALEGDHQGDPFGFDAAIAQNRSDWRQYFGRGWNSKKDEALLKRAERFVHQCPPDLLLWFGLALDEAYKDYNPGRVGATEFVGPLRDIVATDVLGQWLAEIQMVRTIMEHDFEHLGDREFPIICGVQQRMAEARGDWTRLRDRVHVAEPAKSDPQPPATRPDR